ncbi:MULTISPECIES: hypothetical protein [unclassified Pseudomonas]|uniref:hypothetical protein n=1 Tax=unclassified Pseudomonas TaxID=196821 RepID=UPI001EFBA6E0|nr:MULTISPECIES: hypothetical protein [unclassified Pseudomonas]MCG8907401.1 hypothetical protein [Pseudomonas sp. DP-17]MDU4255272.1 hypothetical protein [Pseudomonas sp.]
MALLLLRNSPWLGMGNPGVSPVKLGIEQTLRLILRTVLFHIERWKGPKEENSTFLRPVREKFERPTGAAVNSPAEV